MYGNRLQDKAIIVIGSGSGIGAATVRRLAAEGARVCAADINEAGAKAVADEVVAMGGEAFAVSVASSTLRFVSISIRSRSTPAMPMATRRSR